MVKIFQAPKYAASETFVMRSGLHVPLLCALGGSGLAFNHCIYHAQKLLVTNIFVAMSESCHSICIPCILVIQEWLESIDLHQSLS